MTRPQPHEAHTLTQIALASKQHWGYPAAWLDLWREDMRITPQKIRAREFWTGRLADEIVAFYSIRPTGPRAYELEDFWVAPAFIGRGFGKQMFRHLQARLDELGATRLKIISDPHAVPFYQHMGAIPTGQEPSQPPGRLLPVLHYTPTQ